MLDLHSHMLPGLDDGASSPNQSVAMARTAVEDGIGAVVCTPHWVLGRFDNTRSVILPALELLRRTLADREIPLRVHPGAELRLDVGLTEGVRSRELLTLNDTGRYALIELPEGAFPQHLEEFFWDLQLQKVTPILSHPERNSLLRQEPAMLYRWVEMGVLAQLTAASLLGRFGKEVRRFSALLLEHHLVHTLVSDAHGLRVRSPRLSEACEVVERMMGADTAHRMAREIPRQIIRGEPVHPPDPIPIAARSRRAPFWRRILPLSP